MELGQAWAARRELEQEPVVRMELEQEQELELELVVRMELELELELEPGWAARREPRELREIPFLAALAVPRFPAATRQQAQAQAQAQAQTQEQEQAERRTPNGRCGESDECPAATALESLSSLAGSTPKTEEASTEPRGTQARGAKAWAAEPAGDWETSAERRAKTPRRETFRANPQRS